MNKIDPSTKQIYGHELLQEIKTAVTAYQQQPHQTQYKEEQSPFKFIARKLQIQQGSLTKEEMAKTYLAEIKQDLFNQIEKLSDSKSDTSMKSIESSKTIEEDDDNSILAGESQPIEDPEDTAATIIKELNQFKKVLAKAKQSATE